MRNNHPYSFYVRSAVANIKQQLERSPLKYKTCSDLLDRTSTINRRILEHAFKQEYGYRIKEYQLKQRLGTSKLLLLEGMPIKRVANKCFYSSQSAFCRAFKKEFNMTPTDWMRS
ncbi:helix-turn-helix transcriptional regulator [Niastella sp. OAS944]|uniref:helix-turn-helix transcriptional regulator n=1 Tax=Niastella sp. OAS944 TaxID=2664089 RepID=UPI00346B8691|nr:AraC-like DNA-binding protein [Chitinophagaceae bacterium OAS944]